MNSLTAREATALEIARMFMATATENEFVGRFIRLAPGGSVHNPEQGFMTRFNFPEGDIVDVYVKVKMEKGEPTPVSLVARINRKKVVEIDGLDKSLSRIQHPVFLEEAIKVFAELC
jgi:hypothetical protein